MTYIFLNEVKNNNNNNTLREDTPLLRTMVETDTILNTQNTYWVNVSNSWKTVTELSKLVQVAET